MSNFPDPPRPMRPTSFKEIDKALRRLLGGKHPWARLGTEKRALLLEECITDLKMVADEWVPTVCRGKGHLPGSPGEGETWIGSFMLIMRNLRLLHHAMKHKAAPPLISSSQNANGQHVAKVFPLDSKEKLLFQGFDAELWVEPGKDLTQGKSYREEQKSGKIALVLGAGNQGSIAPMDCLHKLFVENEVCILKLNPVNDYLGPYIIRAFRSLIDGNYLSVVYGGAEVGKYLCQHELVQTIHITGSAKTHDAIVWGENPKEQKSRKEANDPICKKPVTSELGCVDPIMVVPGPWTDKQIDYQARQIVSMATHNAGFNCNSGDVVLMPKGWDKSTQLTERIIQHMQNCPPKKAFYPGTQERYQSYVDHYSDAIICGERTDEIVPWTVFPNVPAQKGEMILSQESFCGLLSITEVDANDPVSYLEKAVPFCNDNIFGSLSCNMLIHPKTQSANRDAFAKAKADLKYGAIGINAWNGVVYGLCTTSWGPYPGNKLSDIGSGIGSIHNTFLIDYPQKSIVTAPFTISPTPAWFYDNRNTVQLGRNLFRFETKPSWINFARVAIQGLRG